MNWRMLGFSRRHRTLRFLHVEGYHATIIAQFRWEPRDLWLGLFWRLSRFGGQATGWDRTHGEFIGHPWTLNAYLCLLPMVPIHVMIGRTLRP